MFLISSFMMLISEIVIFILFEILNENNARSNLIIFNLELSMRVSFPVHQEIDEKSGLDGGVGFVPS